MTKFNPKLFQNKKRVYVKVPRANLVTRLYYWNDEKKEYLSPESGRPYFARRYETDHFGKRTLKGAYFLSLDEARLWQQAAPGQGNAISSSPTNLAPTTTEQYADSDEAPIKTPTLREIYVEWKSRHFDGLARGTQRNYERYVRLHFQELFDMPVCQITPRVIDYWIDCRKADLPSSSKAHQRTAFKHELSTLRVLLKYFSEYYDDVTFQMPLKQRHAAAAKVRRHILEKPKDLSEDEFWRFHKCLSTTKHGRVLAAMAVVQYFQALRICEAAAIRWEDVHLNHIEPSTSRLRICQHVEYPRTGKIRPTIVPGLKNDNGRFGDRIKEQPLFPETFRALRDFCAIGGKGLAFTGPDRELFTYRQIQKAYDTAFAKANLPYRGTHVLRHGGTRRVYNETGDLAIAQQLLGNTDLDTTLVYAKRQKDALTKVAAQHWSRSQATS
jgi:integrase